MREIMPYIWILIIIFSAAAGVSAITRAPLRLIPSSLTAFILSLSGAQVWHQVLLFFILTPLILILSRTFFKKYFKSKGPDFLIGSSAIVTQEINNHKKTGEIKINGLAHSARAEDNNIIYEPGLVVTVTALDGADAVCSR